MRTETNSALRRIRNTGILNFIFKKERRGRKGVGYPYTALTRSEPASAVYKDVSVITLFQRLPANC